MKKITVFFVLLITMLGLSATATLAAPGQNFKHPGKYWHGYPGPKGNDGPYPGKWDHPSPSYLRDDARYILQRTARRLMEAQQMAMRRNFRSGLGLAMAHQQKARELYWQGFYREAIFHSLRARNMALQIISGNRERWLRNYSWEPREENYRRLAPVDADLDNRLNKIYIHSDDDAVYFHFDIDLNF